MSQIPAIFVLRHCAAIVTFVVVAMMFISPRATAANLDPRELTSSETATFLPLVCAGKTATPTGDQFGCKGLLKYPGENRGMMANGTFGLSFSTAMFGQFTNLAKTQALVTYTGDFETHANDWGGAILFERNTKGWSLVGWYPGFVLDHCVMLNPSGLAAMLCLTNHMGQGEVDTALIVVTIPPSYDPSGPWNTFFRRVLLGEDDRQTMDPNYKCSLRKQASQSILIGIDWLRRSSLTGIAAEAGIEFVPAAQATKACADRDFGDINPVSRNITVRWDGKSVTFDPPPPNYSYRNRTSR